MQWKLFIYLCIYLFIYHAVKARVLCISRVGRHLPKVPPSLPAKHQKRYKPQCISSLFYAHSLSPSKLPTVIRGRVAICPSLRLSYNSAQCSGARRACVTDGSLVAGYGVANMVHCNIHDRTLWMHSACSRRVVTLHTRNCWLSASQMSWANVWETRNVGQCPTWWPPCRI